MSVLKWLYVLRILPCMNVRYTLDLHYEKSSITVNNIFDNILLISADQLKTACKLKIRGKEDWVVKTFKGGMEMITFVMYLPI